MSGVQSLARKSSSDPAATQTTFITRSLPKNSGSDGGKEYEKFVLQHQRFPVKLRAMIDAAESVGYEDIISWLPDGDSFRVHKPVDFMKQIAVVWFHQSKYKSFQRQVRRLGQLFLVRWFLYYCHSNMAAAWGILHYLAVNAVWFCPRWQRQRER